LIGYPKKTPDGSVFKSRQVKRNYPHASRCQHHHSHFCYYFPRMDSSGKILETTGPSELGESVGVLRGGTGSDFSGNVRGASLSFGLMRMHIIGALGSGIFKLILLPAMGCFLYMWFDIRPQDYLPGLILLAAPTATVTYVMATEMHGDPELAASISLNTLLSGATFVLWLGMTT
jgi:hypothetical protein